MVGLLIFVSAEEYLWGCVGGACAAIETTTANETEFGVYEKSDVYVWGSNSSHQLAEGQNEKILLPVKSKIFNKVQQVRIILGLVLIDLKARINADRSRAVLHFCYSLGRSCNCLWKR